MICGGIWYRDLRAFENRGPELRHISSVSITEIERGNAPVVAYERGDDYLSPFCRVPYIE